MICFLEHQTNNKLELYTYAKVLWFQTQDYHECLVECRNDLWKAVYRPGLGTHALILKKSFPENKFFICWFFATIVKLVAAMTLHKIVAENLFSFFLLPKCFPSHPLLTTHLCLGFLLSPTVFTLFLLALSLSCHPKKAAGLIHL